MKLAYYINVSLEIINCKAVMYFHQAVTDLDKAVMDLHKAVMDL